MGIDGVEHSEADGDAVAGDIDDVADGGLMAEVSAVEKEQEQAEGCAPEDCALQQEPTTVQAAELAGGQAITAVMHAQALPQQRVRIEPVKRTSRSQQTPQTRHRCASVAEQQQSVQPAEPVQPMPKKPRRSTASDPRPSLFARNVDSCILLQIFGAAMHLRCRC